MGDQDDEMSTADAADSAPGGTGDPYNPYGEDPDPEVMTGESGHPDDDDDAGSMSEDEDRR